MAFCLRHHPRIHNKPARCQAGLHTWETVMLGGRPFMVCQKCGANVFKEVHDHTYTPGTEKKLFRPHNEALEQRRSLLRKRVIEGLRLDRK